MEDLIQQYLFQYKKCPLPQVGSLFIKEDSAVAWHSDNKLSAPLPHIELSKAELPAGNFIAFIATQKKISTGEASLFLQQYCVSLLKLNAGREITLEQAGRFYIDSAGFLVFNQEIAVQEFLPPVTAQRVSRLKMASHNIRVGDTETNSAAMTEFYSEVEKINKEKWWAGALLLTGIVISVLYFYFKDHSYAEKFGNVQLTPISATEQTYSAN